MDKGLLSELFDYSFSTLITPKILRMAYIVATVMAGLGSLAMFVNLAALAEGDGVFLGLLLVPALFLLYMICARIALEMVIVVFRIGDDVRRIADGQSGPSGPLARRP